MQYRNLLTLTGGYVLSGIGRRSSPETSQLEGKLNLPPNMILKDILAEKGLPLILVEGLGFQR